MAGMDQKTLKLARACLAGAAAQLANSPEASELLDRIRAVDRDLETTDRQTTCEALDAIATALGDRKSVQPGNTPIGQKFRQNQTPALSPATGGAVDRVKKALGVLGCKRLTVRP
jgi:hypothetical protein